MSDTPQRHTDLNVLSSNIDAFRRCRNQPPLPAPNKLLGALDDLVASDDPSVVLSALARLSVSAGFSDGCEVEVTDDVRPTFRLPLLENKRDHPADDQASAAGVVVVTPVHGQARGGYSAFSGALTHWWHSHTPDEDDRVVAELLARHAISLIDRERLSHLAAQEEDRAAQLTMKAIGGRAISVATGLVMRQFDMDDGAAEDLLRSVALDRNTGLWELSVQVVCARGLDDHETAPTETSTAEASWHPRLIKSEYQ